MAEKTCWVFFAGAGARCEGVLAGLAIEAVGRVVAARHRVVLSGLAIDANIVLEELACRTILCPIVVVIAIFAASVAVIVIAISVAIFVIAISVVNA